jgi:hypothetical protein
MKLVKNILTLILFVTTFLIISVAQYFTMSIITMPGGNESIDRVYLFPDIESQQVTYADAISFWVVDINESLVGPGEEPEYAIRGLIDYSVWYNNMVWADYLYTQAKALIVPVATPLYEIKELYTYYGKTVEDFIVEPTPGVPFSIEQSLKNTAIRNYLTFGLDTVKNSDRDNYEYVFNLLRKLDKYNRTQPSGDGLTEISIYKPFVNKFIIYSGDLNGEYTFSHVNALAVFVYYQIFLALVLSAYFTYQNPIVIKRNENNENELEGRILPRLPEIKLGNRNRNKQNNNNQNNNQNQR